MSDMRSLVGDLQGALDWEIRARDVREIWVKKHGDDRTCSEVSPAVCNLSRAIWTNSGVMRNR